MNHLTTALCEYLRLGLALTHAEPILASTQHSLWHLSTSQGQFIIKQIDSFKYERSVIVHTQFIAKHFQRLGLPVLPALIVGDNPIFERDNFMYLVFPLIQGHILPRHKVTLQHIAHMAGILSQLHNNSPNYAFAPALETYTIDWPSLSNYSNGDWLHKLHLHCLEACAIQPQDVVISHRDLTLNNIIWHDNTCTLIDWDWAGKISRAQDAIATALNFSLTPSATIDINLFMKFFANYSLPLLSSEIEPGLYRVLANWLNWVTLNINDYRLSESRAYSLQAARYVFEHLPQLKKALNND